MILRRCWAVVVAALLLCFLAEVRALDWGWRWRVEEVEIHAMQCNAMDVLR